jgi:hypothetical protein
MRTSLVLALLLLGCSERRAPTATPTPDPVQRLSLMERLAHEAAHRPAAALPAERVQSTLSAHGYAIERWKQVLASPVNARFCMAGQTEAGVGVAVCEYESAQAAARGAAHSRATFDRLIPNRQLEVNGQTLLTVTRPGAALAGEARRLATLFATL